MEEAPESGRVARTYDPNSWSRRWTVAAGVALLVSFLLPAGWGQSFRMMDRVYFGWEWIWSWDVLRSGQVEPFSVLSVLVLGVGAVVIAYGLSGRTRGIALLVLSLAVLGGDLALSWIYSGPPWLWDATGGAWATRHFATERQAAALLGCVCIAAAAHLDRHDIGGQRTVVLCRVGGFLTVAALLAPWRDPGPLDFINFWGEVTGCPWTYRAAGSLLLMYGVLAVIFAVPRLKLARGCTAWLGRFARLLLGVLLVAWAWPSFRSELFAPNSVVPQLKAAIAFEGRLILVAVGLAAWLEATWSEESSVPDCWE